jgi:SPP1 family phage portal protein
VRSEYKGDIAMLRASSIPINPKDIYKLIDEYIQKADVFIELEEAFCGKAEILEKAKEADYIADNRIVNNYPGYISNVNIGYFMGKPVKYSSNDENKNFLKELQDFLNYNDEQDENVVLAREASIKGLAYEMMYVDSDAQLRIAMVRPENTIVFYDNSLECNVLFAIRFWNDGAESIKADFYTSTEIITYQFVKGKGQLISRTPHYFDDVPIIEFPNNEERLGDFEKVLSLINAYDRAESNTANDFEYFSDAYLLIRNLSGTDTSQIEEMKRKRVLLVDGDGDVNWITKTIQDTATENYKTRLANDIHKFSMTPNLTDEQFAGNLSGVAVRYKLWGLEQLAAQKERKFKKAIQRRIELFCNFMVTKARKYDWRNISLTFTRNMPMNVAELIESAVKLKGIVSDDTLLSMIPTIDDPAKELEKIKQEANTVNLDDLTPDANNPAIGGNMHGN